MMKNLVVLALAFVIALSLCACSGDGDLGKQTQVNKAGVVEYNTVSSFDYSEYLKENEATAVKEGFANTKETTCYDKVTARKLCENELDGEFTYNLVKISYDRTEGIWKVAYSTTDQNQNESNTVSVCIDEHGVTQLIVKE